MKQISRSHARDVILEVIKEEESGRGEHYGRTTLAAVVKKLNLSYDARHDSYNHRVVLLEFQELFRTGYLSWGGKNANDDLSFGQWFFLTPQGINAFDQLSRDPCNPKGYLKHIQQFNLNPIAHSYIEEGISCYVRDLYKASAVLLGVASESVVLDLRDRIVNYLNSKDERVSNKLGSWKIKEVIIGLRNFFDSKKDTIDNKVFENYQAHWDSFAQQIRSSRNETGHPSSISPVTQDTVHANYLVFPYLAKLALDLKKCFYL